MVIERLPVGVDDVVETVNEDEKGGLPEAILKEQVEEGGQPLCVKLTVVVEPRCNETETAVAVDCPR